MTDNKALADKVDRNIRLYSLGRVLAVACVLLLLAVTVVTSVLALNAVLENTSQIKDCITPQGKCYQDGNKRSGEAVNRINTNQKEIVTVAAYCAKQPGNNTLEQIEACINKELNR